MGEDFVCIGVLACCCRLNCLLKNGSPFQEWVTATDIKIVLTRMNTFGDEVFGDPKVLKSYFYAISDLAVGAR